METLYPTPIHMLLAQCVQNSDPRAVREGEAVQY